MTSDIRAQQAREHHLRSKESEAVAEQHRLSRNRLVRVLREEDPKRWTYRALASAVGCSSELIAAIVKGRVT
ncbi:hypothetical protein QNM97_13845 [Gordonia sp. L191]|uniref:hypothetical protein n=1 Tax=Gordonia sp. L191 TaxID=2982699 RepID=UPI0024BFECE5|nr:hypothetical protein [Gordonia sp. L191]WHU45134.1 hypothetical protein QNM97_13845 [Gordonia sp. L191]